MHTYTCIHIHIAEYVAIVSIDTVILELGKNSSASTSGTTVFNKQRTNQLQKQERRTVNKHVTSLQYMSRAQSSSQTRIHRTRATIRIRPTPGTFRGEDVVAAARVRGKWTHAPVQVMLLASGRFHSSPLQAATDAKCPE